MYYSWDRGGREPPCRYLKTSTKDPNILGANQSMVLDAILLEIFLKAPTISVKSIPYSYRIAFSQTLKMILMW